MICKTYRRGVLGTLAQIALLLLALTPNSVAEAAQGEPASIPKTDKQHLIEAYGKIPLSFEANQGQTDARVKFLAHGQGYTLFLTRGGEALLTLRKPALKRDSLRPAASTPAAEPESETVTPSAVIRMSLAGANRTPQLEGVDELPGKANYIIGNDPKKWRTNVPLFTKVTYRDVYPGVDLVYYGNQKQLEHDFVVAPGADPHVITLNFAGPEKLSLDAQGGLALAVQKGEVRLEKPRIYQDIDGARREISGGYVLRNAHEASFQVSAYDTTKSLVIDPTLSYSTYLGNGGDFGYGIAVDAGGNAYVTGSAPPLNFPTTTGAFQTTASGSFSEAFVTKLNPTGSALVYSTYLGGSNDDGAYKIVVDPAGNAYLTGYTNSIDFPTTIGAFQPVRRSVNNRNAFVTELNSTGSALVYSSYLGGSLFDSGEDIAVDVAGNIYVAGWTGSSDFPITLGAFQPINRASHQNSNAFLSKLNPSLPGPASLVYSTYVGGSNFDEAFGVAVDAHGEAYVTGAACSLDFPVTLGAFQSVYLGSPSAQGPGGGPCNAFVTKVDPAQSGPLSLVYSSYLGGTGGDAAYGIAVDAQENANVAGGTCSVDFPVTAQAFQPVLLGQCDAFVTKLNPSPFAPLVYSTFLGGSSDAGATAIAVDSAGNAYVTGATNSSDFPVTPDAFQASKAGDAGTWDAILTVLNPSGSAPLYSTHLGGGTPPDPGASSNSAGTHVALDTNGNVYLAGWTYSISFPTTPGAFQTAYQDLYGEATCFAAKFSGFPPAQP